ncbi:MAG: endonuclease MutS2 [Evtepia gabavorous]|uniref:endonuclease MutS2 n=1 Tax=Evtepia gabavorous TaxID=2211183 RepID=UPI002E7A6A0B|nr:endonuclease MutS2 [Evtepia gabavorous]MEE0067786.1 endonuclease MutS2 [Evtepia gabavorous]
MTDLFEKSMETLELPRVLSLLADQAVTEEGKERARRLRPETDPAEVALRLQETTAAVNKMVLRGSPSFSGVKPVAGSLQRADMGGSLNTRELLDIAGVLAAARSAKEYGESDGEEKSPIDVLFHSLHPNRFLEDKITGSIVGDGELADSASPELASIRRHIRATESKVRDILQKIISSSQAKYLQESIITQRSGRYVVPVKSEFKNEIPGLVHDLSGSGSTFFIEPMGVVKANNELRELQAKEEKEIDRILAELSAEAASFREDITLNYDLLIRLDSIFARGKLSARMGAMEPGLSAKSLCLRRARHPLLPPKTAVANDLSLGEKFDTLVITGPNTGGKTVTLKTIGLLTLMAQCGLHIPAGDGSTIRVCQRVLADIGDEQSIAQSLSTFSSHMSNIVGMLAETDGETLVLFDELGGGTDPVEGAALAAAIIEHARSLGALVAATTHYAELKVYAMTTPGVENASCEFDVETLAPTYRLLVGIPGKSNAFAISQRLGLPQEIIQQAAARVSAENVRFEDVLTKLDQQRQEMEKEQRQAAQLRLEMEQAAAKAQEYRDSLQKEKEKNEARAKAEARAILDEARRTADEVFRELGDMRKKAQKEQDWQAVNDQRAGLRHRLNEAEDKLGVREKAAPPPMLRPAQKGDTVTILKTGTQGTVLSVNKDGVLQLQAGILRITAKQEEVRVVEGETQTQKAARQYIQRTEHKLRSLGAKAEVDLRGMTTDEAEMTLSQFLDRAIMGNLTQVTVIHGKGTGAVRKAVHTYLKRCKGVASFRLGRYGEGEDGVTIVALK